MTLLPAITHRAYAHSNKLVPIGLSKVNKLSFASNSACSVKIQHPGGVGLAHFIT